MVLRQLGSRCVHNSILACRGLLVPEAPSSSPSIASRRPQLDTSGMRHESANRLARRGDSGWWGLHSKTCDDPVVIKAVYFDGDQTLWDFEVLMRRSLTATLTQLKALRPGIRTEDLDIESVVADREAVAKELRGTETNLERIRLAAFSRTLSRLGLPDDDLAEQLNAYYLQHRRHGWRFLAKRRQWRPERRLASDMAQ